MQFNIGLDLNSNHSEMQHNAFPRAKNVLLDDSGTSLITEDGTINALATTYTFSKGGIYNRAGVKKGTTSLVFTITNCTICGYIDVKDKTLLFMYDSVNDISFILRINLETAVYDIIVQFDGTNYSTYSFIPNSIIKGTYSYNYLGQLIIAFNDITNYQSSIIQIGIFNPTFWISNLDETNVSEDSKLLLTNDVNSPVYTSNTNGDLPIGLYFVAYTIVDDNNNESELSKFKYVALNTYDNKLISAGVYSARSDNWEHKIGIYCQTTLVNYRLIIAYKATTDSATVYYKTIVLHNNSIISNLSTLETTSITAYIPNIILQKVGAIEQYDNKLLLGDVTTLDENYIYLDVATSKTLSIELQKIANNVYFTSANATSKVPVAESLSTISDKVFNSDEVYAMYIEFISIYGTSLGTYHIPGRPSISGELTTPSGGTWPTGLHYLGNYCPYDCVDGDANEVVGSFINYNETYPADFPISNLAISTSTLVTNGSTILAGQKVRHHRMIGGNTGVNLTARNIIISSTLQDIVKSYNIYFAKRTGLNNLLLDSGVLNRFTADGNIYSDLVYYMSFESLFNKLPLTAVACRRIATLVADGTDTEVSVSSPTTNWIHNQINAFPSLQFVNAGDTLSYTTKPIRPAKQSYFWNNDLINSYLTFDGVINLYSSNVKNDCYFDYTNQDLLLAGSILATVTYSSLVGDSYSSIESFAIQNGIDINTHDINTFTALNQTSRDWTGITSNGTDIYTCVSGGDIYKQTAGTGNFTALSQTTRSWNGMTSNGTDVYACDYGGDIYKQTAGTGDFVALSQTSRNWSGMTSNGTDVYAFVYNGDIYKQTEGTGNFVALTQIIPGLYSIVCHNSDMYACSWEGDIYKQTNGIGNFIALNQTLRYWSGITSNGVDVYACTYNGDIYRQVEGIGDFVALGQTSRNWRHITSSGTNIYVCVWSGDIYKSSFIVTPIMAIFNVDISSKYDTKQRYKLNTLAATPNKQRYYPFDTIADIFTSLLLYDNPINNDLGIFYKTCFNATNNMVNPIVFDWTKSFQSRSENRIVRSGAISTESTVIGWKNITGLDYLDLPKNKGKIVSIVVDAKRVVIQSQYGLFLSDLKDNITSEISVLPLDLFEYTPIELNKHNPVKSYNPFTLQNTPVGILAISDDTHIYLIGQDGLEDLSLLKVEGYVTPKYNMNLYSNFVHIFTDILHKRILINNPNKSTVLSYNYLHKKFVSEHDYLPKFGFIFNSNPYMINASTVYKFSNTSVLFLGSATARKSIIDIIFNSYPEITKLLQSISWITKSIRVDGTENEHDTFNQLMVYNNTQCSNYIDLKSVSTDADTNFDWFDTEKSIKIYDNFYYNKLYDMVFYTNVPFLDSNKEPISAQFPTKNWDILSSFISNYFIIRFTYSGSNRLIISNITPELIKTAR
jgi:hypothetical protein